MNLQSIQNTVNKIKRPVKILQYGEGNFLRAFVDYMVDIANEKGAFDGNVQIVKPIAYGNLDALKSQDCVYTVLLRGKEGGEVRTEKRVISCVNDAVGVYEDYETYAVFAKSPELRFIVSNTTEAGIVYDDTDDISLNPPKSYPGKLTKFLYERYTAFNGADDKGLIILPVELIENNGGKLKECCMKLCELWNLPDGFRAWLCGANIFCSTLVDRIVTGYPKDEIAAIEKELGYSDKLLVTGEPFALWVIESDKPETVAAEFPLDKAGLPVIFTNDQKPYRERKVRVLNGAHTSSVLAAYLSGLNTVGEMMNDKTLRVFLEKAVYSELVPMVPLPEKEAVQFADSVMERFENPYIKHSLLSISLNSISKFKSRVLPTILETWGQKKFLPPALCFSMAALIRFYSGKYNGENKFTAERNGEVYEILDDAPVLQFFNENLPPERLVCEFLRRVDFWGVDLTSIPGLCELVLNNLNSILDNGMRSAVEIFNKE